jgi:cellobiose dehydrogenase (acceptor)
MVGTPPPTSISELQSKTFKLLARNKISPFVDPSIELVTCAGLKDSTPSASETHFTEGKLQLGLTRVLTSFPPPKFFSATLTDAESTSLTMEKRLLDHFPDGGDDLLLGTQGPEQMAITLDLKDLPLEITGIVCGVSSRLTDGMRGRIGREMFNMSYLSTSRAGHVIVYEDELEEVMDALRGAQANGVEL